MTRLNGRQVAGYLNRAGFGHHGGGSELVIAVAVCAAESSWRTDAHYYVPRGTPGETRGEDSWGLMQVNLFAHPGYSAHDMRDPAKNTRAAWAIYRGAGYRFTPWGSYTNGRYALYIPVAQQAVAGAAVTLGKGGGGGGAAPPDMATWDWSRYIAQTADNVHDATVNVRTRYYRLRHMRQG